MKDQVFEYTTFPRRFERYKWFKPLLVALIGGAFVFVLQSLVSVAAVLWAGGTDFPETLKEIQQRTSAQFYAGPGALAAVGSVAAMLLALFIAVKIVRDRPFSSYSSSRGDFGGWSFSAFFKAFAVAFIVFGVISFGQAYLFPEADADNVNRFTVIGFLLMTVLVPFQAIAEEYVYRGLVMQTLGSWTKLPWLAIVLSSLIFAVSHSYSLLGIFVVFMDGLMFAFLTWYTKGLETSSAAHVVNNLTVFYLSGFGITTSQEGGVIGMVLVIALNVLYTAAIILLDRKFGWFNKKKTVEAV